MRGTRALARLGILAVGIGIGGAVASMPGIAAADSSSDWLSLVDGFLGGGALSAADATPELNLAISFDGMSLFQDGTAYAYSGPNGDIAIANGAGSTAYAFGTNNYASVDGTDSHAIAGAYSDSARRGSRTTRRLFSATTALASPGPPTRRILAASTTHSSSATTTPLTRVATQRVPAVTTAPTSRVMTSGPRTPRAGTTWPTS